MSAGPPLPDLRPPAEQVPMDWPRLAAHLAQSGMVLALDPPPRQFAGGLANLNYLLTLNGAPAVLRRPPLGNLPAGSHDMAREHRILSRLADALPAAPRSLHLCIDPAVLGAPFQILQYRPGLVIRAQLPPTLQARAETGARLSETLLATLAQLHAVNPAAIGLETLGRPEGFLARAIAGWRGRGLAAMEDGTATLHHELGAWLERHAVPDANPVLLHNDFKLDNLILDPTALTAVAIVDWDQGTRGDALFDLATLLSYWVRPGDPAPMFDMAQMPADAAGFLSREAAVARYAALTGRDVSDFRFYRVLAMYKLGVIFLQLGLRWRQGTTTDPRYAAFSPIGTGLLEFTHDIAKGRAF